MVGWLAGDGSHWTDFLILMPMLLLLLLLLLVRGSLSASSLSPSLWGQVDRVRPAWIYEPALGDTATTISSIHRHIAVCLVY